MKEKRLKIYRTDYRFRTNAIKQQLKLSQMDKNNYLCLHIEAIQLMIPTGMNLEKD